MNNKGILKEEVRRILEMMEVSEKKSQLLNEGIIDDIVQGLVKVGTKSGDDVLTVLAKLENEIGIPKGVLDSDDILDLIKGTSNEQITVLSKIVRNLGPAQLDNLTTKVWGQLKDVHTNMLNGVTSIKSSGGKITPKDIDEMSEIAISSTKPGFDPLINALRKEFKTKMTKSLEGYIDASGSAGKVSSNVDDAVNKLIGKTEDEKIVYGGINDEIENLINLKKVNPNNRAELLDISNEVSKQMMLKATIELSEIKTVWDKLPLTTHQKYINDAIKNIENGLPPSQLEKFRLFKTKTWSNLKQIPKAKQAWEILKQLYLWSLIPAGIWGIGQSVDTWEDDKVSFKDKVFNTFKYAKDSALWPRTLYKSIMDEPSGESNTGVYAKDYPGFKKWVEESGKIWDGNKMAFQEGNGYMLGNDGSWNKVNYVGESPNGTFQQ